MRKKNITHIMLLDSHGGVRLNMGASRFLILGLVFSFVFLLGAAGMGAINYPEWQDRSALALDQYHSDSELTKLQSQQNDLLKHLDQKVDQTIERAEQIASQSVVGVPESLLPLGPLASKTQYQAPTYAAAFANHEPPTEKKLEQNVERLASYQQILESVSADLFGLSNYIKERENILASIPSIQPAKGLLTSNYGRRKDPFTGMWTSHEGIDIAGDIGDPVYASADGRVVFSGERGGYGTFVSIEHDNNITSQYGHLSARLVQTGDTVKRGDLIGRMGNSGRSTGPHLHYEILVNNAPINPMPYILR